MYVNRAWIPGRTIKVQISVDPPAGSGQMKTARIVEVIPIGKNRCTYRGISQTHQLTFLKETFSHLLYQKRETRLIIVL